MKTFDDAVVTNSAQLWLRKYNAMPSTWNLGVQELVRWRQAGVRISIFNSPACLLPFQFQPEHSLGRIQLALIDAYRLDDWISNHGFKREELIATLLHEIGHAVNCPTYPMGLEEEFGADDYARHCGYDDHLRSALEKLLALDPEYSTEEILRPRIQRITDKEVVMRAWLGSL